MNTQTSTFSVRIANTTKARLEKLAETTGRSRAFLAAQAIDEYIAVNEWQVQGIKKAIASLEAGKGISWEKIKPWLESWGTAHEKPMPKFD